MDPVTAFTLGATALQVALWGCEAIHVCRDLSSKGATQTNINAYNEATDLGEVTKILSSHLKSVKATGPTDQQILRVARQCDQAGRELRSELEKLRPKSSDGKLRTFGKALQTLLKGRRISELEDTLRGQRDILQTSMLTAILYVR